MQWAILTLYHVALWSLKRLTNLIKDYLELYGNIVLAEMSSSPLRLDLIMYLLRSPGSNGLQSLNHTPSVNVGIA